ncbi:transcriptional regulator SOH1-like protein [Leptotrombidium deliense]|uniref:Mediator of RNA polymerase II transcription subunit 31 n=1 Tax=Leptotrombidium deliense TaxID=299467 RepID=A0A443SJ95_9ACAR|nr:transcriptional regulator SOH1-like protein [Leptotrombidium deliense]
MSFNCGYDLETEDQQRLRFQVELEFVQCLANPNYLNFLAQRGILKDKAFINYLTYLQYWKRPEYAKFLNLRIIHNTDCCLIMNLYRYPMCLSFLDLLQYEHFRKEITSGQCAKFIEDQQLLHWQFYIRKRTRLLQQAASSSSANNQENSSQHLPNSHQMTAFK